MFTWLGRSLNAMFEKMNSLPVNLCRTVCSAAGLQTNGFAYVLYPSPTPVLRNPTS